MIRRNAAEAGERVFDELTATTRLDIDELMSRTSMSRAQVYGGIRYLRDLLSDNALVTNADHTYELALNQEAVDAYRRRRLSFLIRSLERLLRVVKAGVIKFGNQPDGVLAVEAIAFGISLLKRGTGVRQSGDEHMAERVR